MTGGKTLHRKAAHILPPAVDGDGVNGRGQRAAAFQHFQRVRSAIHRHAVMLEKGVSKNLYLRHFEEKTNRSDKLAIITLGEGNNVQIKINEKKFKNSAIYKGNEKRELLEKGSNDIKLYHTVVLQEEKHGSGTRKVCLEFKEC